MYNLTVDEAHTFFVGDGQWLVHNAGVCDLSSTKSILDYLHNNGIARQVDTVKIPMRAQDTFFDNRYVSLTLEKRLDLYRVGTSDIPLGQYFSLDYPKSVLDARINNAILPMWPDGGVSPLDTVFAWNFPQNTTVHLGLIKPQSPTWLYQGMNHQIFVNQPWNISGKIFSGKWPIPNILR